MQLHRVHRAWRASIGRQQTGPMELRYASIARPGNLAPSQRMLAQHVALERTLELVIPNARIAQIQTRSTTTGIQPLLVLAPAQVSLFKPT
jgi:hypothetical protein